MAHLGTNWFLCWLAISGSSTALASSRVRACGFESGRYSHSSTPTCESARSIDLAWLRRRGMLKPGRYSLTWSSRGEPAGSISIVAQAAGVHLLYWVLCHEERWSKWRCATVLEMKATRACGHQSCPFDRQTSASSRPRGCCRDLRGLGLGGAYLRLYQKPTRGLSGNDFPIGAVARVQVSGGGLRLPGARLRHQHYSLQSKYEKIRRSRRLKWRSRTGGLDLLLGGKRSTFGIKTFSRKLMP